MATTNPDLAIAAVDAVSASGASFAILHGEAQIAAGEGRSDIDVVVATSPLDVMAESANALARAGLRHIIAWPYDVGGTGTMMLATSDGLDGVQLDLLHDPSGEGQDGFRSQVLLESRVPGNRWPQLDATHQYLYLVRKRDRKGDVDALHELLDNPPQVSLAELKTAAMRAYRPDIAGRIIGLLEGRPRSEPMKTWAIVRRRGESARRIDRLRRPIGFWANVSGPESEDMAHLLADRFGAYLPRSATGPRPRGSALWQWPQRVVPIRWRAGLYTSWGTAAGYPRADVELHSSEGLNRAAEIVVDCMEERVRYLSPGDRSGPRRRSTE